MKKLSVVIANRHQTSISLEEEFLDALKSIAEEKKLSLNQLITEIDSMREHENLSSAIRVYILQHLQNQSHPWNFSFTKRHNFSPNSPCNLTDLHHSYFCIRKIQAWSTSPTAFFQNFRLRRAGHYSAYSVINRQLRYYGKRIKINFVALS